MAETSGYLTQLVDGLRSAGARADFLDLAHHPFEYSRAAGSNPVFRLARWLTVARATGRAPRLLWTAAHRAAMAWLFAWAMLRYDAVVLRAGDSFFAMRDLALMRRLGKHVIVVFFGSDSRPSYMNGSEVAQGLDGHRAATATAAKRRLVERTERQATTIVCHVLSAQLHRRPVVPFLDIGIPRRLDAAAPRPPPSNGRAVRALHAPSRPDGKGTDVIRAAAERVRASGIDLELRVLTGRPNREVEAAIRECDFVIDEVYSDTPMAGFAAEAAALGRPAVVGGYGWDELARCSSPETVPPTHCCRPDELEGAIARLATDHAYRIDLGRRSRAFVESRWSPIAVAERILSLIAGDPGSASTFDPQSLRYVHGAGIDEDRLRETVRGVVESDGPAGLGVADKPVLERRLLDLAAAVPLHGD
jgi:hypothetical protein